MSQPSKSGLILAKNHAEIILNMTKAVKKKVAFSKELVLMKLETN